ncbi:MAG: helix-turn-helix domain containing protein [Oscillospiraceae bacterium]|nr:helix-turn-helix domain containing protein [Oscillospiraceae bacterium]
MARKYHAKATIEAILSASASLFLEKGFDKTSMQEIAAAAGISKGAIYHHFRSKDEILQAVAQRQAQAVTAAMETLRAETGSLRGSEQLRLILEKNLESQEAHDLDDIMCVRMKSAEFVLSYMQNCVNMDAAFVSEIIRRGIADGSLTTAFPDECAEVFLLLLNVWCDPAVFDCDGEKLSRRLKFLQHLMKSLGMDVLSDALLEKYLELLRRLYPREEPAHA